MSRWTENFENHAFQDVWKQIKEISKGLSVFDKTVSTNVEEMARLKKAITFLDELIISCDPELLPANFWDQFHSQSNQCLSQLSSYVSNENAGHIANANNNLDHLLSYLKPYVTNGKASAQAAGKAFKSYTNSISKNLKELEEEITQTTKDVKSNKINTDDLLQGIETSKLKIENLEKRFFEGNEDEESLEDHILALQKQVEEWHEKVKNFHEKLTKGNEEEAALVLQIDESKKKTAENAQKTDMLLSETTQLIDNLKSFYDQIFGKPNKEGKRQGGLRSFLDVNLQDLEKIKSTHQTTYKTLEDEIESLMPGATTAGLATAYKELKLSFDRPIKSFTRLFYGSLTGIFIVAFVSITEKISSTGIDFVDVSDPMQLFNNLIFKLPILLPLLWLAIFSSKRRSEDRRLQQEYAHKEAIAKSYQAFKKQIKDLNTEDDKMMLQLLDKAILAIAFNASETLDGKHGDKLPLESVLEKIFDKFNINMNSKD